jgi:hypothetical protein
LVKDGGEVTRGGRWGWFQELLWGWWSTWEDTEESFTADLDETSVRLFFKGVSSSEAEGNNLSGIGVVMERSPGVPVLKVQKKLDFYVEELVAEHLALMDGLLVALQNGIRNIFAFTNSEKLYFQASAFWEGVLVSILSECLIAGPQNQLS